jgi:predicted metal-dependent HD superfamily phosphohydrolase
MLITKQLPPEQTQYLTQRWAQLCEKAHIPPAIAQREWERVAAAYRQPHRAYHNLSHIYNLLELMQAHTSQIADIQAFEWAIWYHDVVYDLGSQENEILSAAQAVDFLTRFFPANFCELVKTLILSTQKHEPLDTRADTLLFLDLDLCILASPPLTYAAYEQAIADEYTQIYPLEAYTIGRKDFLTRFLQKERIFYTKLYQSAESIARENIQNCL